MVRDEQHIIHNLFHKERMIHRTSGTIKGNGGHHQEGGDLQLVESEQIRYSHCKHIHVCMHCVMWSQNIVNHFWYCCRICDGNLTDLKVLTKLSFKRVFYIQFITTYIGEVAGCSTPCLQMYTSGIKASVNRSSDRTTYQYPWSADTIFCM